MIKFEKGMEIMKSFSSWLLVCFLVIFWIFRVAVAFLAQYGKDFGGFIVFDETLEMILLFVSLLCFVLIVKRLYAGPIIYLLGYGFYFGKYLMGTAMPALMSGGTPDIGVVQNTMVALVGIILGIVTLLDLAVERMRRKNYSDDKTDWFFNNKKYERKLDERADKNQYRTL